MNGQAKIELMLELKNKIRAELNQAQRDTVRSVDKMQTKMNSLKFNFVKHSKAIGDEVPMIGQAFKLATNPIALTAAGIMAVGKGIDYTTQKAADFNTQFRALANLNLDKSKKEIESLKRSVMDTAFDKGFNTQKTITGYFDVQSTTGKFGGEVKQIVEKQGEFANLMQADFNEYIAGTAKGMANFGFGYDKLDEFNRSAYATVKVGVTTFDQLAKVQSVYAGSAAANGQSFDTANKFLALFTVKTKSVDEAATLTKSMFNDLTKDSTIKAFNKVGISIYDNNGKIKQADTLMLELNKKFSSLSDKEVVALKNQFPGSDGLIAMIQASTDKSGQLQNTFNSFDATKLGLNKALELAKNDVNYINENLQNKVKALEIKIGTDLLPLKEWWAQLKLEMVNGVMWAIRGEQGNRNKRYSDGWTKQSGEYTGVVESAASLTREQYTKKLSELNIALKAEEDAFWKVVKDVNNISVPWYKWGTENRQQWREEQSGYVLDRSKGKMDFTKNMIRDFQKEWETKTNFGRNVLSPIDPNKTEKEDDKKTKDTTTPPSPDNVSGSSRQVRNLTVNIEAFNKGGINTEHTTLKKMDETQIEEWFTDMCMRIVHSIETSY